MIVKIFLIALKAGIPRDSHNFNGLRHILTDSGLTPQILTDSGLTPQILTDNVLGRGGNATLMEDRIRIFLEDVLEGLEDGIRPKIRRRWRTK